MPRLLESKCRRGPYSIYPRGGAIVEGVLCDNFREHLVSLLGHYLPGANEQSVTNVATCSSGVAGPWSRRIKTRKIRSIDFGTCFTPYTDYPNDHHRAEEPRVFNDRCDGVGSSSKLSCG